VETSEAATSGFLALSRIGFVLLLKTNLRRPARFRGLYLD